MNKALFLGGGCLHCRLPHADGQEIGGKKPGERPVKLQCSSGTL